MMGGDDYGDYQQPRGGYGGGASGGVSTNYSSFQNPPSVYGQNETPAPPLTSGLGNGVNLQPSYFEGGNVDLGWVRMQELGLGKLIKSVRIEIDPLVMDMSSGADVSNATRWINEAVSNGYSVIATFRNAPMLKNKALMDDENLLREAAEWWEKNYSTLLKTTGPFTINLMNEWGSHNIKPDKFAAAYNNAIAIVRSVYGGPIIVDIPGYGQEAHTANLAITGTANATIEDRKIILSAHIYPDASTDGGTRGITKADLDELDSTGLACMVGEFGDTNSNNPGTDWEGLVNYAKSKGWPVFGWAWNGDGGAMNMITPQFQKYTEGQLYSYKPNSPYFDKIYQALAS